MIFHLVEALGPVNKAESTKYNASTHDEREQMIDDMIDREKTSPTGNDPASDYSDYAELLKKSSDLFGYNDSLNPFFNLIEDFHDEHNRTTASRILERLYELAESKRVRTPVLFDIHKGFENEKLDTISTLINDETVNRSDEDLAFIVNLTSILSDENKLRKYFHDISQVNLSDLLDASGNLKPVGEQGDEKGDTIVGSIHLWAEGGNDAKYDPKPDKDEDTIKYYEHTGLIPKDELRNGALFELDYPLPHPSTNAPAAVIDRFMSSRRRGIYKYLNGRFHFVRKTDAPKRK